MGSVDIEEFVSKNIASPAFSVSDVVAKVGERAKRGDESSSIGEELREKEIQKEEERGELNSLKAGFSDLMKELAASSTSVEGAEAGKTSGVASIWEKIQKITKTLDFNDPSKLAESGKMPVSNKTSTGKIDNKSHGVYGTCKQCGKVLEKPSKNGFCSKKCMLQYQVDNVKSDIQRVQEAKDNIGAKINAVAQLTSAYANSLSETSEMLSQLNGLDERYIVYFKVAIANIQIYLKKNINDLLVAKNQWIIQQAQKAKADLGVNKAVSGALEKIEKVTKAAEKLEQQMNEAYDKAYDMVVNTLAPFKLEPESMNFNMTIRSNTYYPGKMAVKLKNNNANDSIVDVVNIDGIDNLVETNFPHITENEFTMEPEAFEKRKIFSEYNVVAIKKLIGNLMAIFKLGSEPLPVYEDLKITNVWWMVFLLTSFEPQSVRHYALPFCP